MRTSDLSTIESCSTTGRRDGGASSPPKVLTAADRLDRIVARMASANDFRALISA